jgi:lipoprotein-releasing system ATP-binding protein
MGSKGSAGSIGTEGGLYATGLTKAYATPRGELRVLDDVSLSLKRGDAACIMGPSGSGKSTLLYVLGALDPPSSGGVTLDGQDPYALHEREQAEFRNRHIGFVFQDHALLPQCSVLENVLTPTLVARRSAAESAADLARAREILDRVGLSDRLDHRPAELSRGEKQRVAIARALIREPLLVLCDEPTGNLDASSAQAVARLLMDLHARNGTILLVVTHSAALADLFPMRYRLEGRRLARDGTSRP